MKEFKGTPGPWFVGDFGGINGVGSFIGANTQRDGCTCVARVNGTEVVHDHGAKLIAAAPELLDALQKLHSEYERLIHNDFSVEEDEDTIRAHTSINKALGEEK